MAERWVAERPGGPEVFELVSYDVPPPGRGEVTIEVRAAGVNPADASHVEQGKRGPFPRGVGYEVAGVLTAVGPSTTIASGGGAVGDEVLAFRVNGGYASRITVPAKDVFAKPESLDFPAAANLLLAGTTAMDMLRVTGVTAGETILVHGASGAVGVMVLQLARLRGIRAIGTTSDARADVVRGFGGEPVRYGDGLLDRVRELARDGVDAALDCVGTDEAVDVSLALAPLPRIVTIAAHQRARQEGFRAVGGMDPESRAYRDEVRAELIALAGDGRLEVPMARTFPLDHAAEALALLADGHPGGKIALIP